MKKITAFFLLLLPLFITALMFISGLIQNLNFPVSVAGITINEPDQDIVWNEDDYKQGGSKEGQTKPTFQFTAHVLPLNAKNQEIKWTITDESVASIDADGKITLKNYGRFMVTATAVGNPNCTCSREVDSFDRIIHDATISNKYELGYLAPGTVAKPTLTTSPSIDHAEKIDSIQYEIKPLESAPADGITIDPKSGIFQVKNDSDLKGKYELTSTIKSSSAQEGRSKDDVKAVSTITVGPALDCLSWKDSNTDKTITDLSCDLYNELTFGPAVKDEEITRNDFTYESSNTDAAIIENDTDKGHVPGTIKFDPLHPDEYVTFTVTYKRNTDLKISKRIKTTNNDLKEVFFTQPSLSMPYTKDGFIPKTSEDSKHPDWCLDWVTYPKDIGLSNISITSTNEDVVAIIPESNGTNAKLQMVNPGKCALLISASTESNANAFTDVCEVTLTNDISSKENILKTDAVTIGNDQYLASHPAYYFLRDNIKVARTSQDPESIRFELTNDADGKAYIDENNILHFKSSDPATAGITAYVGEDTIGAYFTVAYAPGQIELTPVEQFITIDVGTPITLKDAKAVFDNKYYSDYFDVIEQDDKQYFIAKCGCDISDFETTKGQVHLTVVEEPIYITSEQNSLLITPEEEVDFLNVFNPKVFPSSATKSDGSTFEPVFDYHFIDDCGTADQNVLNFNKIGTCKVNVDFGVIHPELTDPTQPTFSTSYLVRCTYHDQIGKFKVTTNEFLPISRTTKLQYSSWNADESGTFETLRIDNVAHSLYDKLEIKSMNGLCNPTLEWVGLLLTGHIKLNLNPITGKYGSDIIEISSPTYSLFLKVDISAKITDFTVTCQQDIWGNEPVLTYTNNLNLRVTPNTINKEGVSQTWGWSVNSETPTKTDLVGSQTINLKDVTLSSDKNNVLYLFDESKNIVKTYQIQYKTTNPKFSLYGDVDGIYTSCNSNSKSTIILADGYVDDDIYKELKITDHSESGDKLELNGNLLNLDINDSSEAEYENTFNIKYKDTAISKTPFNIGRDQVSKIKLVGHNIFDQSDKKGMQKVHVYGNHSYYNETAIDQDGNEYPGYGTEGYVNYYKVPIKLYNRSRAEIGKGNTEKDKQARLNALKSLKISVGGHSNYEIDPSGRYIRVFFDKHDLYTPEQIYNNAFDTKTGKNIDFHVSTKSNEVYADYKFVAVEGTNSYTQDAIMKISSELIQNNKNAVVLQKNFGVLPNKTVDNAIFDDEKFSDLGSLYGNGYCLDLKYISRKKVMGQGEWNNPYGWVCLNADINGADNDVLKMKKTRVGISINASDRYSDNRYFAYSNIHHFIIGIDGSACESQTFIKNTAFHSSIDGTMLLNGFDRKTKPTVTVENSTFFNSASFPICSIGGVTLRFKGNIGLYNFLDKEMLRRVAGEVDLTDLWPIVVGFASKNHMLHKDFKGDDVINSFMVSALNPGTYFWDYSKNDWVQSVRGITGSGKYLAKYCDLSIPFPGIGRLGADLWGGTNPSYEAGAPSYYDEFDNNGNLKLSFLIKQINDLTRRPIYF